MSIRTCGWDEFFSDQTERAHPFADAVGGQVTMVQSPELEVLLDRAEQALVIVADARATKVHFSGKSCRP
jgi:hypothetical protein